MARGATAAALLLLLAGACGLQAGEGVSAPDALYPRAKCAAKPAACQQRALRALARYRGGMLAATQCVAGIKGTREVARVAGASLERKGWRTGTLIVSIVLGLPQSYKGELLVNRRNYVRGQRAGYCQVDWGFRESAPPAAGQERPPLEVLSQTSNWDKLWVVRQMLDFADWVFWLDADAVLVGPSLPNFDSIASLGRPPHDGRGAAATEERAARMVFAMTLPKNTRNIIQARTGCSRVPPGVIFRGVMLEKARNGEATLMGSLANYNNGVFALADSSAVRRFLDESLLYPHSLPRDIIDWPGNDQEALWRWFVANPEWADALTAWVSPGTLQNTPISFSPEAPSAIIHAPGHCGLGEGPTTCAGRYSTLGDFLRFCVHAPTLRPRSQRVAWTANTWNGKNCSAQLYTWGREVAERFFKREDVERAIRGLDLSGCTAADVCAPDLNITCSTLPSRRLWLPTARNNNTKTSKLWGADGGRRRIWGRRPVASGRRSSGRDEATLGKEGEARAIAVGRG